ncbi:unnamed protein product [Lota lota]
MERTTTDIRGHAFHHLSFCGRIVSLQCKRGNESNASEILCRSLTFNTEQNSFLAADDGRVLYKKRAADVDIVTCACVHDVQKRVSTPFILLKQGNKEGSYTYVLLALSSSMKQETKMTFKLPYQLSENVYITHGPIVLWTHVGVGFHACVQEERDVGVVRPTPAHLSRPLIGVLPLHKGDVFMIGPVANQFKKGFSTTETLGNQTSSQSTGYLLVRAELFDAAVMLPCAYIPVTQSLLVLRAETVNGALTKSSVVAATSEKQLVRFENGVPKDVCRLPFDGPEDIRLVDTGRNGRLITVRFGQGHVCAVWEDTFQVAAHWSAVRSVHADDFLGCGTEQLLLVFEDEDATGRPLDAFLLTDLCGVTVSSGQRSRMDSASHPAGHNHLLTFQALESRLQSGLTVVQELQSDDRLKQRVVLQSIKALSDMVSGRDPVLTHPEQEGLFSLWDEDEEPAAEVCDDEMQVESSEGPVASSRPRVERLWHRFMEEHLVVGATVTMDGAIPVDCVSLSVLTNASLGSAPAVIQTRSQVFLLPAPHPPGPAAKRSKQDHHHHHHPPDDAGPDRAPAGPHRLAVTAVTPLTCLLSWGRVKCPVMLRYVQRETAPGADTPAQVAFQCGHVSVDIRTDFHGGRLTDPSLATEEGLLSGLSVLDHWVFHVDSPHHSLGDMEDWMQRATRCKRSKVNLQYLVAHSEGAAAAMLLRWSPASVFRGELSVHASRLQTLQFLERLCGFLLASCTVRLLKGPGTRTAAPLALTLALENEALALRRAAWSLLSGEEEEEEERRGGRGGRGAAPPRPPDDSPGPRGSEEERGRRRREWDEDLGWSRRRLSPPVDAARYRTLTRRLSEAQLQADVAVLLQTRAPSNDSVPRR